MPEKVIVRYDYNSILTTSKENPFGYKEILLGYSQVLKMVNTELCSTLNRVRNSLKPYHFTSLRTVAQITLDHPRYRAVILTGIFAAKIPLVKLFQRFLGALSHPFEWIMR
jgi:hypothetical protein